MVRPVIPRAERIRGCLWGLAVGDALGAPVTGLKAGRVHQLFGDVTAFLDAREAWGDRPWRWSLPGLHAAPTQQALATLAVVLPSGEVSARAVANLWLRMAHEPRREDLPLGAHRGASPTFRHALGLLRAKEPMTGQPSAGSGAVARAAPLGAILGADPEALTRAVIDLAILTHRDPRAIAGALTVAHAVALFVAAEDPLRLDPRAAVDEIAARVRAGEERLLIDHLGALHFPRDSEADPIHAMSGALAALAALVQESDDDLAIQTLLRQANRLGPRQAIASPTAGFAPATVAVALYFALAHMRVAESLSRLVSEGKGASVAGAALGALLGARLGEEAIPADWRRGLLAHAEITEWANAMAEMRTAADLPDLLACELAWTLREQEARTPLLADLARRRAREERRAAAPPKRIKPEPAPQAEAFAPPPQTYLRPKDDRPGAKQRERAARGRKRIAWKDERRERRRP